jgi:hypothetical protein
MLACLIAAQVSKLCRIVTPNSTCPIRDAVKANRVRLSGTVQHSSAAMGT